MLQFLNPLVWPRLSSASNIPREFFLPIWSACFYLKAVTLGKQTSTNPNLSEANPTSFSKCTQLAFQAVGEILRMSQQEFRGLALKSGSVPPKQFCVNNLAYQSQVAQIPICLIMDLNLLHREKKVSLPKELLFETPSFMIFTPQLCLFKGAWDLVGAFFYKWNTIITYVFHHILKCQRTILWHSQ